jgi:hypothetical protein
VFGKISINSRLQVDNGRKMPRRMRCRVILEKKFSAAVSQDAGDTDIRDRAEDADSIKSDRPAQ